jgi:hypothetical protein
MSVGAHGPPNKHPSTSQPRPEELDADCFFMSAMACSTSATKLSRSNSVWRREWHRTFGDYSVKTRAQILNDVSPIYAGQQRESPTGECKRHDPTGASTLRDSRPRLRQDLANRARPSSTSCVRSSSEEHARRIFELPKGRWRWPVCGFLPSCQNVRFEACHAFVRAWRASLCGLRCSYAW